MLFSILLGISLATPDLRLELTRESLTGAHHRYRQYIDGRPVVGGEVNVTIRSDGTREEVRTLAAAGLRAQKADVWVNVDGVAHPARREVKGDVIRYISARDGSVVRTEVLSFPKGGRVFDPNPVVRLNRPDLRDDQDSPGAVPPQAYSDVELPGVNAAGALGGPYVQIADFQEPFVPPVDSAGPLTFDRDAGGFEDVNAYFHIDRSQRRLQTLGFAGPRAIAPYAIQTDTHAAGGADDSFFIASSAVAGTGRLHFGEGGTDDAEDSDLVVHEYAHAIHEWISPGTFLGSYGTEARAMSEGFGDYWAFSAKYAAARASGRDPHCIADWDARCWTDPAAERCAYPAGADCLRRTDSVKTIADLIRNDNAGTEHRNGEIWSSALTEIFLALTQRYGIEDGRRASDVIVIESLFGTPPRAGFATVARQMLAADRYLFAGTNGEVICAAMTRRGILRDCAAMPRGEVTLFPGNGSGIVVPDNDPTGVTLSAFVSDARSIANLTVSVDIRHSGRGELRVSLIAPDGTVVRLHEPSPERAPNLTTTFGRDSLPIDALDVLRGRSAAGEWRLRVVDVAFADVATVVSWSVNIQFAGQEPSPNRPGGLSNRRIVPVVGHAAGANGTFFRTDLRLLNSSPSQTHASLVFTPSGADGRTVFGAVSIVLPPQTVVAIDDVVARVFGAGGLGQLEISSGEPVAVSTRTWTRGERGTFGFSLAAKIGLSVSREPRFVAGLRTTETFRTNLGFAEISGAPARVTVKLRSALASETFSVDVLPHSHVQVPVAFRADPFVAEVRVEGEGRVMAYGAVVDNRSGDAMVIDAVRAGAGAVFPAISAPGANGTHWRTEITVTSIDGEMGLAEHSYRAGVEPFVRAQTSEAFVRIEDAVVALFRRPGTVGTVQSMTPANLIVTARVWTHGPGGTYGMTVQGAERHGDILHVEHSPAFRTNIGVYSSSAGRARATLFDADGRAVRSYDFDLQPFQLVQFPITDPVLNGRVRVTGVFGLSAYGAVVDNVTGDAVFVPAQ